MQETWVLFLDREEPLEKEVATHSTILAGEFHGQRSLEGYSPRGHKEWDTTEWLSLSMQSQGHFHQEGRACVKMKPIRGTQGSPEAPR